MLLFQRFFCFWILIVLAFYEDSTAQTKFDSLNKEWRNNTYNDTIDNYIPTDYQSVNRGRQIFIQNCSVCHGVTHEVIGPALAGIHNKRPVAWTVKFVKNSQKVINSGDEYAVHLYNQYDKYLMPPFEFLSIDEITDVLAYVKDSSTTVRPVAGTVAGNKEISQTTEPNPLALKDIFGKLGRDHPSSEDMFNEPFKIVMIAIAFLTGFAIILLAIWMFKKLKPTKP
jgi:mono/diheme cytochrome c family protein